MVCSKEPQLIQDNEDSDGDAMAIDALSGKMTPACWSRRSLSRSSSVAASSLGEETRIWTRSALKAELLRVLGILDNVNRDVSAAVADEKVSPAEWEQYAVKWRDFVEARGGRTTGPHTEKKPETSMLTVAVYGGLVVGAAAALGHLINSVRK